MLAICGSFWVFVGLPHPPGNGKVKSAIARLTQPTKKKAPRRKAERPFCVNPKYNLAFALACGVIYASFPDGEMHMIERTMTRVSISLRGQRETSKG